MTKPPEKPKSSLVFWLGCLTVCFLLGLIAVGAGMLYMARRDFGGRASRGLSALPAGWRDSLRAMATVPAEGALAPPRTEPGDAAPIVFDRRTAGTWVTMRRLELGTPLQADDSALVAAVRADRQLDTVARAARMREFRALDAQLERPVRDANLYGVNMPNLFPFGSAAIDRLVLRGELRRRDGKLAEAEQDARAVIGLGAMLVERSPSWFGLNNGRSRMALGARLLEQVARARRDTATAAAAARLRAWAARREGPALIFLVVVYPDSALSLAEDSTMPFPARAHGLAEGAIGSTVSGFGATVSGPRADVVRRVRALRAAADADLARVAAIVDSTLGAIDDVGMIGRLRWTFRRMER